MDINKIADTLRKTSKKTYFNITEISREDFIESVQKICVIVNKKVKTEEEIGKAYDTAIANYKEFNSDNDELKRRFSSVFIDLSPTAENNIVVAPYLDVNETSLDKIDLVNYVKKLEAPVSTEKIKTTSIGDLLKMID